jgi:hypothetical protein
VYEPENEQGIVYLFSHLARRRFGLTVERLQRGFPDCVAYGKGRRVRIEFEFRSRGFLQHRHDPRHCDWIVCWIHDWPGVPKRLRVVELRREFGLGFHVWFQPVAGKWVNVLARTKFGDCWSVPSQAIEGDLVLYYCTRPHRFVRDIFRVASSVGEYVSARCKRGKDWMAAIRRVCTLKAPIHLTDLQQHPVIRNAGFVRGQMQGRYKATAYWPELYRMILDRNPSAEKALKPYGPERVQ